VPASNETAGFLEACRIRLQELWSATGSGTSAPDDDIAPELLEDIRASVNSRTKTYRYVLPTQLLAKLVDHQLDCRIVQAGAGVPGSFDARSLASKVISPFDLANERVLGGTTDPYVNNPLRIAAIVIEQQAPQKDKAGFGRLCTVLQAVEDANSPPFTAAVYRHVLREIRSRLETVQVTYPFPHRISLDDTLRITSSFLEARSGGDRFQALLTALFEQIGASFGIFASVRRTKTNTADASSGALADVECIDGEGRVVMAVEAKDRKITVAQLEEKIPIWRSAGLTEGFFISPENVRADDAEQVDDIRTVQFRSGYNIYCISWNSFASSLFALIGESGRSEYLKKVARQLDEFSSVEHRRAWAELLQSV
jgi:hypothetical protein